MIEVYYFILIMGYSQKKQLPIWFHLASGIAVASFTELLTIPFDTIKVRLQIQQQHAKSFDMVHSFQVMIKEEGAASLFRGIIPGIHKQFIFTSIKIMLYDPIALFLAAEKSYAHITFTNRVFAALISSTIATIAANPTDLVKIKIQASYGKSELTKQTFGSIKDYQNIIKKQGLYYLWNGSAPNIMRNCLINASNLLTYDSVRLMIKKKKYIQNPYMRHFLSSAISGILICLISNPIDLIKTRIMNSKPGQFNGVLDCARKAWRQGGLGTFYNGFEANACRYTLWNFCAFYFPMVLRKKYWEINEQ